MIWASHGVVDGFDAERFCHRNLFDRDAFARHLDDRERPYVGIDRAAAGEGEALTIDDATVAAAEAARMAVEAGHQATLFVNPEQIACEAPYHFALLNVAFDRMSCPSIEVAGRTWPTATLAERGKTRKKLKSWVGGAPAAEQRSERALAVAEAGGVDEIEVPAHFETLGLEELRRLAAAGVTIGNHGWSHASYFSFSHAEVAEQVRRGRAWLEQRLEGAADHFAVPYGELLPPEAVGADDCSLWLLNTDMFRHGAIGDRVFNRPTLRLS